MIEACGLEKKFGATRALNGLGFAAHDGAITGLLGPNGAGKTTALRILCGVMQPDAGTVEIDGISTQAQPLAARARLGVLPDGAGLYPRLTAREHIRYFGKLHGLSGAALEQRIDRLAEQFDMGGVIDRRTQGFSHGERIKTTLARALVHDPPNVILDEPTNGLDVNAVRSLRKVLSDLREQGRCVIFSSHVMQEVAALCDRLVVVYGGRVVAEGTPERVRELAGRDSLEDAFVALTHGEEEQ
ncbi:MAG: ATP-binding cassette domain-containing protein [Acidobacteria bacterium]|nr:ATP-binding cassette domain-containing protein [Acidobacteriota bacterium]